MDAVKSPMSQAKSLPTLADAPLGMGVGGMTRQDLGRLESLSLGRFTLESPLTSFSKEESGANANPNIDGNVGSEVLRRFTLWIDYGNKRILLRPNEHLGDPFEYDMSGMVLRNADATHREPVVIDVLPDSPATHAGGRTGATLLGVNRSRAPGRSFHCRARARRRSRRHRRRPHVARAGGFACRRRASHAALQ